MAGKFERRVVDQLFLRDRGGGEGRGFALLDQRYGAADHLDHTAGVVGFRNAGRGGFAKSVGQDGQAIGGWPLPRPLDV